MVERLRAKPGGAEIPVTIGDMATHAGRRPFRLVYLVFNTIVNLTSQDAQVACFRNAAAHLDPGGYFVVEVGVPELRRCPPGERANVVAHAASYWGIDEFDVVDPAAGLAPLDGASDHGIRSVRSRSATSGPPSST